MISASSANETSPEDVARPQFNPLGRAFQNDPYAHYSELRRHNAVHRAGGMVVITRYEDVRRALTDPALSVGLIPSVIRALAESSPQVQASRLCEFADKSIVFSEGPLHTRLRSATARCLTRSRVEGWRAAAREVAWNCALALRSHAEVELVGHVAATIPRLLLGRLLGLSADESAAAIEAAHGIRTLLEPISASAHQLLRAVSGLARIEEIIGEADARRGRHAGAAPLLELLQGLAGSDIEPGEAPLLAAMVYVAGHDTTVALIASSLQRLLLCPPGTRQDLLAMDGGIAALVRETARFESPLQLTLRQCLAETRIGILIEPGERVLLSIGSANRDETVFADAAVFDPGRSEAAHLSFGLGLHGCLGNLLAVMEAEEAVRAVAEAVPELELIPDAHKWSRRSLLLRALERMPVRNPAICT